MQGLTRLAIPAIVITLAACGSRQGTSGNQGAMNNLSESNPMAVAQTPAASPSDRLLAAAEPFEALTETAFTDPPKKLDQTIALGRKAVADVRGLLNPSTATMVDGLLAAVNRDRGSDQRGDLALSSIEIYRSLVSSVPAGTKVPVDVSLLDYAGFRYQADLKAAPVRWEDMKQAVSFAQGRWAPLSPKIADKAVSGPFAAALAAMDNAVAGRDSKAAQSAVTAELDQVDKLETYFNAL
jgi:hypothetical protein